MSTVKFSRHWAMPNKNTFSIKPINRIIHKYLKPGMKSIDPFANESRIATVTNDINNDFDTDYHLDAIDFMKIFNENEIDCVLYDPPYSLRQVVECYKGVGVEITKETTQSSWRTKHIDQISKIVRPGGIAISFGWNSNGIGKGRGFQLIEVMIVSHGGSHNDTIVTVERKNNDLFNTPS